MNDNQIFKMQSFMCFPHFKLKLFFISGDDKVKTERELPPFIYGRDFKCQNFDYKQHQYFHVHGGIEFDISTHPVESALDEFKVFELLVLLGYFVVSAVFL
jgi:hypothetical protein